MSWQAYEIVLLLRSPLHIGHNKVGNLQRTRPYVTGRALWGALTMRLTRDAYQRRGPASDSRQYQQFGEKVHSLLGFTYFYPALKSKTQDGYDTQWPWLNISSFRYRFLSSQVGTALFHPACSAAEGMLHEVEFISPHTRDFGEPTFLIGYVFEKEGCDLDWRSALKHLQLGGERGYGWGDVDLVRIKENTDHNLFGCSATFDGDSDQLKIHIPNEKCLLAHVMTETLPISGDVEPLVGREWKSNNPRNCHSGQHIGFNGVCFVPGSTACQDLDFEVGQFGIWRALDDQE